MGVVGAPACPVDTAPDAHGCGVCVCACLLCFYLCGRARIGVVCARACVRVGVCTYAGAHALGAHPPCFAPPLPTHPEGEPALHIAANGSRGRAPCVQALVEAGADVLKRNRDGEMGAYMWRFYCRTLATASQSQFVFSPFAATCFAFMRGFPAIERDTHTPPPQAHVCLYCCTFAFGIQGGGGRDSSPSHCPKLSMPAPTSHSCSCDNRRPGRPSVPVHSQGRGRARTKVLGRGHCRAPRVHGGCGPPAFPAHLLVCPLPSASRRKHALSPARGRARRGCPSHG